MKILHITNSISEGGVGTFLLSLLPALKKAGYDVELLVLDKNNSDLASDMERQDVKVHIGKYENIRNPMNIFWIRKLIKKYDIVHSHLFPSQYWVAGASILSRKKTIMLTSEHGVDNRRRHKKLFKPVEKFIYRQYRKVVCVNDTVQQNLDIWANTNGRSIVIYNGVDVAKFENAKSYTKKELDLPDDSRCVIMVARFFDVKDHKTLIKAFSLLPQNIYLLFCGSGETYFDECVALVHSLKIENRVRFLGNRKDVDRLIKSSDIGVLSTNNEGMPLSVLEYMSSQKPVVVSDVEAVNNIVRNYGVLFPKGDYHSLANEILLLLNDSNYYEQVAQKCYARALNFSQEAMITNYVNLYNQLFLCKTN